MQLILTKILLGQEVTPDSDPSPIRIKVSVPWLEYINHLRRWWSGQQHSLLNYDVMAVQKSFLHPTRQHKVSHEYRDRVHGSENAAFVVDLISMHRETC